MMRASEARQVARANTPAAIRPYLERVEDLIHAAAAEGRYQTAVPLEVLAGIGDDELEAVKAALVAAGYALGLGNPADGYALSWGRA